MRNSRKTEILKIKKFEKLESQVKTGLSEFEELRRSFDAAKTGTPYEQALVKTIGAMINLSAEARNLTLVEKEKRGRSDIKALWTQMLIVRNSLLQDDFVFTDVMNTDAPEISPLRVKRCRKTTIGAMNTNSIKENQWKH